MRLAAIDIGSNAARLLISEARPDDKGKTGLTKLNLIRVPLRLGFDVFEKNEISSKKIVMLMQTMKAFSFLLKAYEVKQVRACATSAMRDAVNGAAIIKQVKLETGIKIEIINGDEDAMMIYENHIAENLDREHAYLYIDVGGGSTELSFMADGKLLYKESINVGTIRILKNMVENRCGMNLKQRLKPI